MELSKAIEFASRFEGAELKPHFEKLSFRVRKKIYATLDERSLEMVLKLSTEQQADYCDRDPSVFPVKGGWGKKGWTTIALEDVSEDIFADAVTTAYCNVAPRALAAKYQRSS